ncbi:calponin-3-like isoform X1 [Saccoglossus kowalevskii]|uniref:Calponin n=1 Tax=Saccoglossus kowalevskii TaxID=10224 RepID=A0ABM0GKS7_SACKO|nr:PREDICTED: calponin-3-like isoform 2 [Saccoglossus kowalevskii]
MANRGRSFGLSAELKAKQKAKYDIEREKECRNWIEGCTGNQLSDQELGSEHLQKSLKNGIAVCNLINVLAPGSVKKINESTMAFKQMENIGKFLDATKEYGVPSSQLFQTVDLYEGQNMVSVIDCIWALASQAQKKGYAGPVWGVKVADKNVREFDEATLRAGQGEIGLQAGYNKGATQAGMTAYGTTRHM